jgi:hypothetical protein
MDPYDNRIAGKGNPDDWNPIRRAMGHARAFPSKVNLAAMPPRPELTSTRYCLANPGQEYLTYQPASKAAFTVIPKSGTYAIEWFNPSEGKPAATERIAAQAGQQTFTPPFSGPAVLYLKVASASAQTTIGIRGDTFTVDGQGRFLLGASDYDGNGWKASDLDALRDRRFNLIRIFLDLETISKDRTFLDRDGSLRNAASLLGLVRACASRGIVVDVTILNPFSSQVPEANMETAVRNTVRLLRNETNVFYDVCNEHNHDKSGITHDLCRQLIAAIQEEHQGAIATVSSAEYYGAHWLDKKSNTQPKTTHIEEEIHCGIQVAAPHFLRAPTGRPRQGRA